MERVISFNILICIYVGPEGFHRRNTMKSGDFSKFSEEIANMAPADKLSEMAKVEFSLEKLEERHKENLKLLENQVKKAFKAVSLKWIEVEDTLRV